VDAPACRAGGRRFESDLPHPEAIAAALAVIEALRGVDPDHPAYVAVERAAAHLRKSAKKRRRLARKRASRAADRALLAAPATSARTLRRARRCYTCKQPFRELHALYQMLCPSCAERNARARADTADLAGRRAVVTGGRIKVGFAVARALLRAGARVVVTTRFPGDAARRFADCSDAERARLEICGLDFRDLRGVLAWIDAQLARAEPLDILVNNAAQTIARPQEHHAPLLAPGDAAIDVIGDVDGDGFALDLRARNSWVLDAADVEPRELVEVHLVNALAPFLFASRLKPLLVASRFPDRYIVNVSSMEGVFDYAGKQPHHPHTNMAKAALNMFTRTSAADYVRDGIYMTSVDPGWISQENPRPVRERAEASGFVPPLDAFDAAARVLAPILRGVRGAPVAGVLFKDFEPAAW
jgi:NAD(P)-dependent dehydrogenase (short-subunit alcohol dehydrogenase family)